MHIHAPYTLVGVCMWYWEYRKRKEAVFMAMEETDVHIITTHERLIETRQKGRELLQPVEWNREALYIPHTVP